MTGGTPLHLAPAHSTTLPIRYVVHHHSQACDCCNRTLHYSKLYAEHRLKSRLEAGKYVTHLRHLEWPSRERPQLYDLPIIVKQMPVERLPFCHLCNQPSLRGWPTVPEPEDATRDLTATWQRSHTTSNSPSKPKAAPKQPSKPKTVDQLLDML